MKALRRMASLLVIATPLLAQATTLFGVVTERAAPTAIEAAHRHLANHPNDRILLRTPAQLMAADDKQLGQWLSRADSVLAVSIFGDPARRLKDALARHARPQTPILAMNGEASLNLMSRDATGNLANFPAETLRQLALENPPESALTAANAQPTAWQWLAARRIWQAGGLNNTLALFAHQLNPRQPLPTAKPEPTLRLRVGQQELSDLAAWGNAAKLGLQVAPTVIVLDLANMDAARRLLFAGALNSAAKLACRC